MHFRNGLSRLTHYLYPAAHIVTKNRAVILDNHNILLISHIYIDQFKILFDGLNSHKKLDSPSIFFRAYFKSILLLSLNSFRTLISSNWATFLDSISESLSFMGIRFETEEDIKRLRVDCSSKSSSWSSASADFSHSLVFSV